MRAKGSAVASGGVAPAGHFLVAWCCLGGDRAMSEDGGREFSIRYLDLGT